MTTSAPVIDSLRVLFVAPYLPSAIRVRPYELIQHLAKAGHRVTVAALDDGSPADGAALAELQAVCDAVYVVPHGRVRAALQAAAALPTPTPLWAAWCHSPQMLRLLKSLAASGQFDVAHVEHLRAAHFAAALGHLPCVFDSVDCITDLQRQVASQTDRTQPRHWLAREEAAKLRCYEPRVCNRFKQVVVTSRHDAQALVSLGVRAPVTVIPNGVAHASSLTEPKRFDLIFSGKMSYHANEDAALYLLNDILPQIDRLLPHSPPVTVCIAGAGPSERLRRAAARWEKRVTLTGWVEYLHPHLAAARIAVCPMRIGVGIQNKVLEAMAIGLPVIATPLAGRALHQNNATTGLRIASDTGSFARHCAELLQNDSEAQKAGQAGRHYVQTFHRWETAAASFVEEYRKVL